MVSALEALAGRETASEEALQKFVAAYPRNPPAKTEQRRAVTRVLLALSCSDGAAALRVFERYPGINPAIRGRAQLLVRDYAGAEISFTETISLRRGWGVNRLPVIEHLAHFHLGQICEATARRDDTIREYRSFLSHYIKSRSRLPQIAEARASLKRLGE